jgi:NAD(P)H-dependent FMN reductase
MNLILEMATSARKRRHERRVAELAQTDLTEARRAQLEELERRYALRLAGETHRAEARAEAAAKAREAIAAARAAEARP